MAKKNLKKIVAEEKQKREAKHWRKQSRPCLTSQPESWIAAFKAQAKKEGLSMSAWVGYQCYLGLPAEVRARLPKRAGMGKVAKKLSLKRYKTPTERLNGRMQQNAVKLKKTFKRADITKF